MAKRRPVADRLKRLKFVPDSSDATLNMAEFMLRGLEDSEDLTCTVNRHCRTRIFDFPGARAKKPIPSQSIYKSVSVRADVVFNLENYFKQSKGTHYSISPPLRHEVNAMCRSQDARRDAIDPYVVVEEVTEIVPVVLDRECAFSNEVSYRNGERTPLLKGGRDNEKFILAFRTSDGKWPDIPNNEQTVNMVLAAIRVSQDAHDEIRKHVDQSCLVTDDGQYVSPQTGPSLSARASMVSELDADAFSKKAVELKGAISRMEVDLHSEHIELLVNTLYWDKYRDDDFRRLHYLGLWQSLAESNRKLGYVGPLSKRKLRDNDTVVAGERSLADLTQYRDDIAHWWTGTMDGNYLADIYRTINELIRRKYFL